MDISIQVNQAGPSTSKGLIRNHEVMIDRPESKGGADKGAMGGELLLAALGGCFSSNLLAAITAREAAISDVNITVTGTLDGTPANFSAIDMKVAAEHDDAELLEKLITISERSCIVANTLKDSVKLTIGPA